MMSVQDEDNQRIVDAAVTKYGGLHASFINAGVGYHQDILDISDETIDVIMDTNFKSVVFGLKHQVLTRLRAECTFSCLHDHIPAKIRKGHS